MIRKILTLLKKIVFSSFVLYGYNLLATPLNVIVPINLITIFTMTFLGIPSLFAFIIINVLIF